MNVETAWNIVHGQAAIGSRAWKEAKRVLIEHERTMTDPREVPQGFADAVCPTHDPREDEGSLNGAF
jgi:hypothetical protein